MYASMLEYETRSGYDKIITSERIQHAVAFHRSNQRHREKFFNLLQKIPKSFLFENFYNLFSLYLSVFLLIHIWLTYFPHQFCFLLRNFWVPIQSNIRSNPCITWYFPVVSTENENEISCLLQVQTPTYWMCSFGFECTNKIFMDSERSIAFKILLIFSSLQNIPELIIYCCV